MNVLNKGLFFLLIFLSFGLITSCDKEDEEKDEPIPEVDEGDIHPNRFKFTLVDASDTSKKATYEFYDPDGIGGAAPIVLDTLVFNIPNSRGNRDYNGSLEFFRDSKNYTSQIRNLGEKYTICYRDQYVFELGPREYDRDNNNVVLGLSAIWNAEDRPNDPKSLGKGDLRITMNYNILTKDGTCDAGVRVFEGTIPYKLTVN